MNNGLELYSLTAFIMKVWETSDEEGRSAAWKYLNEIEKPKWFRRVIFKHSKLSYEDLVDIAEDAFITAWDSFDKNGKLGKIKIEEPTYIGYLFRSFKNNFLKGLEKRQRGLSAEEEFGIEKNSEHSVDINRESIDFFSPKTTKCLQSLSPDARTLLIWKHVDGKSYTEIALLKGIERDSVIKLASRYKQQFIELWKKQ